MPNEDTMNTKQMLEALQIPEDYEKPTIPACDGNAFSIFAAVGKAVRRVDPTLAERYAELRHKSDSYDTVLGVAVQLVDFSFPDDDFEDEDESYDEDDN